MNKYCEENIFLHTGVLRPGSWPIDHRYCAVTNENQRYWRAKTKIIIDYIDNNKEKFCKELLAIVPFLSAPALDHVINTVKTGANHYHGLVRPACNICNYCGAVYRISSERLKITEMCVYLFYGVRYAANINDHVDFIRLQERAARMCVISKCTADMNAPPTLDRILNRYIDLD